jgi:ATP-dependent DNA helicase PIF1
LSARAILASTIEVVDKINNFVLGLLPGMYSSYLLCQVNLLLFLNTSIITSHSLYLFKHSIGDEREYLSADKLDQSETNYGDHYNVLTPEFLNSLRTFGMPNHKIKLKIGTPIMLMRNIDQSRGLCNGTRLIITHLGQAVLGAKVMCGKNRGDIVYIHRMEISPSQSPWPFKLVRRQFPIIVSYAMTINKSQGQSLDCVGLFLPNPVFSHGQLYVVVSRVKSKKGLKILILDEDKKPTNVTTNVVFKEVFQNI